MLSLDQWSQSEKGNMLESVLFPVTLDEGGLTVKNLVSQTEKMQAFRLRHQIFCGELGWVLRAENGLETDEYDARAVPFGVYGAGEELLSYLRLIMPDSRFMLEKEFLSLVSPEHAVRKHDDTAEISRLCVAPVARHDVLAGNFGVHRASLLLFKGVYHWCLKNGIRFLYAVTELKVYRLFCAKGFPYKLIGDPKTMADGVVAVAVMMDWREFEAMNAQKRPGLLKWFNQNQLILPAWLSQPREFCSPH